MCKFLIIGHARSGSTLLCRSLDLHPDLKVYVEALHPADPGVIAWRKSYVQDIYKVDTLQFIQDGIYTRISKNYNLNPLVDRIFKDYNGFKILFQQLPLNYNVWAHLVKLDLKIIYIRRKNLLESALSIRLAERSHIWQVSPGQQIIDQPIDIDPIFLRSYFQHVDKGFKAIKRLFQKHESLEIEYEDLCRNWNKKIMEVETFLNVKPTELIMSTGKRTQLRPSQAISNYKELESQFKNTPWYKFFNVNII